MVKMVLLLRKIAVVRRKVKPLGLFIIMVIDIMLTVMFLVESEVSSVISSFLYW